MIVVSDTSPLNYLVLIGCDHVLPALFGRVLVPEAVISELRHPATPTNVRNWASNPPSWLEVRQPATIDASLALEQGEMEAICLACELNADALLIDERKGAAVATNKGLFVTGTLGVLEIAAERGMIRLPETITALRMTSFRASPDLLTKVLARAATRARQPGP